jgi:hypothetical protein
MINYFFVEGNYDDVVAKQLEMVNRRKAIYKNLNVINQWSQYSVLATSGSDGVVPFSVGLREIISGFSDSDSKERLKASDFLIRYLPEHLWGHLTPAGYLDFNDECVLISELFSRNNTGREAVIDVFSLNTSIVCSRQFLHDAGWEETTAPRITNLSYASGSEISPHYFSINIENIDNFSGTINNYN